MSAPPLTSRAPPVLMQHTPSVDDVGKDQSDSPVDDGVKVPEIAFELFSRLAVVVVVSEFSVVLSCKPLVSEMELRLQSHGPLSLCFSNELGSVSLLMESSSARPAVECLVVNVRCVCGCVWLSGSGDHAASCPALP